LSGQGGIEVDMNPIAVADDTDDLVQIAGPNVSNFGRRGGSCSHCLPCSRRPSLDRR
jgi:hypothetical protein